MAQSPETLSDDDVLCSRPTIWLTSRRAFWTGGAVTWTRLKEYTVSSSCCKQTVRIILCTHGFKLLLLCLSEIPACRAALHWLHHAITIVVSKRMEFHQV